MSTHTVAKLWRVYADAVGVPSGGVQWRETEQAFYAGCSAFLSALKHATEMDDASDDAEGGRQAAVD